jgi:8-oxo-dGTP pyrophosphatase MutT (NUDIX family)
VGYIQELRELVGHRPIIMVGAAALILDPKGRLLLQRRADDGRWGLPGGSMEPGESIEETVRREVLEETGLKMGAIHLFGVFSGAAHFHIYPNGDQIYDLCVAFVTHEADGNLLHDHESLALRFFRLDTLPPDITPLDQPIISRLRSQEQGIM